MIKIDTEQMKQMVDLVNSANNGIEEALANLRQISSHGDWHCRERSTINENADRIRNAAQNLQESGTRLGSAIRITVDELVEKENDVINWMQTVEEITRRIITIKPKSVIIGGALADVIKDGPFESGAIVDVGIGTHTDFINTVSESLKNAQEAIPRVDFQSLAM